MAIVYEAFFEISTNDITVEKTFTVIADEIAQKNGLVLALENGKIVAAVKEDFVNVCVLRRLDRMVQSEVRGE